MIKGCPHCEDTDNICRLSEEGCISVDKKDYRTYKACVVYWNQCRLCQMRGPVARTKAQASYLLNQLPRRSDAKAKTT